MEDLISCPKCKALYKSYLKNCPYHMECDMIIYATNSSELKKEIINDNGLQRYDKICTLVERE